MKKTIKINDLIFERIKYRYHFYNDANIWEKMRQNKLLVDTFYPFLLANNIARREVTPTRLRLLGGVNEGFAISERVAEDLDQRQLHISELITMLGYTKTDISKLLQYVKAKELKLALVGAGGTGSNFLHWIYEMCEWTGKTRIFTKVTIYDDDDFDIPNMLRIPFIPQFKGMVNSSKKVNCIPAKFKIIALNFVSKDRKLTVEDTETGMLGIAKKLIIYGAPDIETREFLSASEYTFVAATHRDSEFSLVENPTVDNDLMLETYGKINLSKFFLNHLTMTIEFLKYMRDKDTPYGTTEESRIITGNFDVIYYNQIIDGFKAGA
jgi:hypothetical protein